jgi:hypothetical protein
MNGLPACSTSIENPESRIFVRDQRPSAKTPESISRSSKVGEDRAVANLIEAEKNRPEFQERLSYA